MSLPDGGGSGVYIGWVTIRGDTMNATVTRSSTKAKTKTATSESVKAAKPKTKPVAKPTKTPSTSPKPASKTATATTKAIANPAKSTVKSSVKTAVSTAPKKNTTPTATRASSPKKTTASKESKTGSKSVSEVQQAKELPVALPSFKEMSGSASPNRNGSSGFTDKMENSVVSKASEVANKTTNSTPDALLTEEQILKMSEKDYMNEAQLAFFKARLQQLERDLLKNAGETTEHLRETVLVPDPADRATIEEEHALELRTRDRERKLLKKVQQSLAAIESGDYGWCEETGEPIGIPRLLARPTATLSLEAQQRRELKQKLYGD